jgi:hypothetical protein
VRLPPGSQPSHDLIGEKASRSDGDGHTGRPRGPTELFPLDPPTPRTLHELGPLGAVLRPGRWLDRWSRTASRWLSVNHPLWTATPLFAHLQPQVIVGGWG